MTCDTSARPISPLRARMIENMTVRGFKDDTRRDYVRNVRAFAAFIGRSPDTATAEERRLFRALTYLARYTHRVAIANSRLMALDPRGVTFRYKDYRRNGQARYLTMSLAADEFIRR